MDRYTWDPVTSKRGFPRVVQQLGYTWEYLPPNLVRTHIPTLPYEAFDNKREKVLPWKLLHLVESVETDSFWPAMKDANDDRIKFTEFLLNVKLNVNQEFYKVTMPKHPLVMEASTKYMGKTSRCLFHKLYHDDAREPYVTMDWTSVCMDMTSRKPTPYPTWLNERFKFPRKSGDEQVHTNLCLPGSDTGIGVARNEFTVVYSDTDSNNHTNFCTYARFTYDSIYQSVLSSKLPATVSQLLDNGVKLMEIQYRSETLLGDKVTVTSWIDPSNRNTIQSVVMKGDVICCDVTLTFYSGPIVYKSSKL